MDSFKVEVSEDERYQMNVMIALALIKNLFLKGKISELVYKNILKEYEKVVEIDNCIL